MTNQRSIAATAHVIPALISAEDLAKILEVSTRTLWRLKSRGAIPKPVKFGGTVRWRATDIQEWLAEGCPEST